MIKISKQKLIEMFIVALLSAGIAFLQSFLVHFTDPQNISLSVTNTGLLGFIIHGIKNA